jgi:hypothetical protein
MPLHDNTANRVELPGVKWQGARQINKSTPIQTTAAGIALFIALHMSSAGHQDGGMYQAAHTLG